MAAGDRDHGAGRVDARTGDEAIINGLLEPKDRPAHVANSGEAPHERVRRFRSRKKIVVAYVAHYGGRRRWAD